MKPLFSKCRYIIQFLLLIPFTISCENNEKEIKDLPVEMFSEFSDPDTELISAVIDAVKLDRVAVYPNPFENHVEIYSSKVPDQILIIFQDGNSIKFQPSGNTNSFDFSRAEPGIYYCEVLVEEKIVRLELIKVNF